MMRTMDSLLYENRYREIEDALESLNKVRWWAGQNSVDALKRAESVLEDMKQTLEAVQG